MAILTGAFDQNGAARLRGQIVGLDESLITQSDLSAIQYEVWDLSQGSGVQVIDATTLTIGDVIFDSPQSWDIDSTGYNFAVDLPGSSFPNANVYRVDVKFTPATGEAFYGHWEGDTTKTYFNG